MECFFLPLFNLRYELTFRFIFRPQFVPRLRFFSYNLIKVFSKKVFKFFDCGRFIIFESTRRLHWRFLSLVYNSYKTPRVFQMFQNMYSLLKTFFFAIRSVGANPNWSVEKLLKILTFWVTYENWENTHKILKNADSRIEFGP